MTIIMRAPLSNLSEGICIVSIERHFTLLSNLLKNLPIRVLQRWRNVFKRFVVVWDKTSWNMNDEKTEFLQFGSRQQLSKVSLPFIYGLPQNQISRLQHIQNTTARVVTLSRKSCHITPILKELHWLPVSQRIVFKLMLIVHKSVNNIAPIYISELLNVFTPSRNLRSSNMSLLKEPTSKRTWGDRLFSVAAPRLWNHLPTKLRS